MSLLKLSSLFADTYGNDRNQDSEVRNERQPARGKDAEKSRASVTLLGAGKPGLPIKDYCKKEQKQKSGCVFF